MAGASRHGGTAEQGQREQAWWHGRAERAQVTQPSGVGAGASECGGVAEQRAGQRTRPSGASTAGAAWPV